MPSKRAELNHEVAELRRRRWAADNDKRQKALEKRARELQQAIDNAQDVAEVHDAEEELAQVQKDRNDLEKTRSKQAQMTDAQVLGQEAYRGYP